jgi:NitT/TauT family transport system substrate-binding protein
MLTRCRLIVGSLVLGLMTTGSTAAEPLKVTFSSWVGLGPLYVAKEKGFFDEEGLEVELIVMDDHKAKFAALAAGETDVNAMSVDEMLNYLSEEQGYRYLFAVDESRGGDGIIANKDIQTVADLKGKSVAYEKGIVSELYLGVLLKEVGLSLGDIDAVNLPFNDAGAAFVEQRVDAAVTGEPWLTKAKQSAHGHLLVDSSSSPGLIVDMLGTTPEKLAARADDLKALYRAWIKAVEFQKANEKEADLIMARGIGGWLEGPAVLAEARAGIAFYDDAMNKS